MNQFSLRPTKRRSCQNLRYLEYWLIRLIRLFSPWTSLIHLKFMFSQRSFPKFKRSIAAVVCCCLKAAQIAGIFIESNDQATALVALCSTVFVEACFDATWYVIFFINFECCCYWLCIVSAQLSCIFLYFFMHDSLVGNNISCTQR